MQAASRTRRADESLAFCAGKPREEPSGAFVYDNCDHLVLGAVLEEVTPTPFTTLVTTRLRMFEPRESLVVGMSSGRRVRAQDRGRPDRHAG